MIRGMSMPYVYYDSDQKKDSAQFIASTNPNGYRPRSYRLRNRYRRICSSTIFK